MDEAVELYFDPSIGSRESSSGNGRSLCRKVFSHPDEHIDDQFELPYVLEARPSPEFAYSAAITKLFNALGRITSASKFGFIAPGDEEIEDEGLCDSETGFSRDRGRYLKLAAYIDMESRISVGCAGAALAYIGRRKTVGLLPANTNGSLAFRVSSIEMFNLSDLMYVMECSGLLLKSWLIPTGS